MQIRMTKGDTTIQLLKREREILSAAAPLLHGIARNTFGAVAKSAGEASLGIVAVLEWLDKQTEELPLLDGDSTPPVPPDVLAEQTVGRGRKSA